MKIGVFGAKIKLGSAKSMLRGGIEFRDDIKAKVSRASKNGAMFTLLKEKE